MVDDLSGPRLRIERLVSALDDGAAHRACGLALDGMHDALATEQVVARGGHGVVDVFKTDRALQFLLERLDIVLHLRGKLLFAPGVNDHVVVLRRIQSDNWRQPATVITPIIIA